MINNLAMFLFPHLLAYIFPYDLLPAFIGEVSMSMWLIFKGVNVSEMRSKMNFRANFKGKL